LAAFTHNLETAFDEVRNGRLAINSELIDLTLTALDRIRVLLEDNAESAAAEAGARAEILARVGHMIGAPKTALSEGFAGTGHESRGGDPRLAHPVWRREPT